jgi:phosphate transport system permease protein
MARARVLKDIIASGTMRFVAVACVALAVLMAFGLLLKAWPVLKIKPVYDILFSSSWSPMKGNFGLLPFITGTLWVTGIALVIAVPISLLTSVYLSEYAPRALKEYSKPLIDLLAGIPSVIYGLWGVVMIVPLVRDLLAPAFGASSSGFTVLTAGIVLSVMILPVIIHISMEVLQSIPPELREASLALGAGKWETIKYVVLRKAMPGIVAANVLGLSRAFGETMAVLMVAGNVVKIPVSPFDPGYPLPALIANNYGEMLSIPLYDSALLLAALVLLAVVICFSAASRYILHRLRVREST